MITEIYPSTSIQAPISEAGPISARILLDHHQKMYMHQLLRLCDDHPTKKLLPISFTNGDGDTTRENGHIRDNLA